MRLAIIGAAELGKLIAWHAVNDGKFTVTGYYDDFRKEETFNGAPVLGKTERIIDDYHAGVFDSLMIGIGYNHMKVRAGLFESLHGKVPFANVIHSSCYVDSSCILGEGIFLLPRVTLDMEVKIGNNVLINTAGSVAHHSVIGDHCFLAPNVHIAGLVRVEQRCFVGIGSTIVDCIHVASDSLIGAGSVVIRDTEQGSVNVGVPSRKIKSRL